MDDLLGMKIGKGVAEAVEDMAGQFLRGFFFSDDLLKRPAVHPFHLYAVAQALDLREGVVFANVDMVEGVAYFEFFPKDIFIQGVAPVLGFEAFQGPEASSPVDTENVAESMLRAMDEFERSKAFLRREFGYRKKG